MSPKSPPRNTDHPKKRSSIKVEPIRDLKAIKRIKKALRGQTSRFVLVTKALVREYIREPDAMLLSEILSSLLAAWALHKFIETPAINFGRSLTRPKSLA